MVSSISSIQPVTKPLRIVLRRTEESEKATDQFPEGGIAAWCTVFGAFLVQLCCFGYTSSFGVYQEYYTLNYLTEESSSAISWIGSINAFMITSFSLVAGILYDRGYFYHLMIGGSLLESFTLFMLSLTQRDQYYQILLVQGIGLGLAQGLLYLPVLAVVSHYFHRRRTLAMSLVTCGSSIGSIVHPIMLNYLFNRGVGFANGVRISAALVSTVLLIACLLMRTRLDPPKQRISYLHVGRGILHDVPFCFMSIGLMLFQIGFYYPLFYLQLDSVKHGNPETFSFYSLVSLNGGSFLGRLSAGFIASYVGVPGLMIISTATCGILILGMAGLSNVTTVIVAGSLYLPSSLTVIAMLVPLMALLSCNFSELGARTGIALAVVGIGCLLGGPTAGALLTSQYKWWQPSVCAGLIALTGCLFIITMQAMLKRRRKHLTEEQESHSA